MGDMVEEELVGGKRGGLGGGVKVSYACVLHSAHCRESIAYESRPG